METDIHVCPKCGQIITDDYVYCSSCGFNLKETHSVSSAIGSLKSRFSLAKDASLRSRVTEKAVSLVSREKASNAVQKMMEVVTYVAQDMKKGMSSEMVKAVTVNARMSFVAFSVGVSIALDKLPLREEDG